jgi:hypothetical protein
MSLLNFSPVPVPVCLLLSPLITCGCTAGGIEKSIFVTGVAEKDLTAKFSEIL